MSRSSDRPDTSPDLEAESTERWVSGKSEEELLADLRSYSARLRDDPHSLHDRLRVAAIQLRLGRIEEALIHYEGVLRGYVSRGQIVSAIALCKRILRIYPDLPRLQRILAALYARLPHDANPGPTPVTPISELEIEPSFLVHDAAEEPAVLSDHDVVVDRLYSRSTSGGLQEMASRELRAEEDLRTTMPYEAQLRRRTVTGPQPIPLTQRKSSATGERQRRDTGAVRAAEETKPERAEDKDDRPVVLLTKRKK